MRNQFALYRVNPLTSGKVLWHKTFEEVREMGIPVRIELYRPYHLELLAEPAGGGPSIGIAGKGRAGNGDMETD